MAASGHRRLSGASTPHESQFSDDDIITKQLQADLNLQAESNRANSTKKAKKRKSRDILEGSASDEDESPKKKRKRRDREKRKERKALEHLHENGLAIAHDTSSIGAEPVQKVTNGMGRSGNPFPTPAKAPSPDFVPYSTGSNNNESRQAEDKIRRNSSLSAAAGRTSLGLNREALLQSILKGCSPDKLADAKSEHAIPSESESGNAPAHPEASSNLKTSSKAKPRHRVSMVPVLPEGYKPGMPGLKGRYHCPVEGCEKLYTRRTTLGEHMNTLHRGQKLKDNMDGTMSMISLEEYNAAISSGNNKNIVEIQDNPITAKPEKGASRRREGKKEKKDLPATDAVCEASLGSDIPDETEHSRHKALKTRPSLSKDRKSPPTDKPTPSKTDLADRMSSEYETSDEDIISIYDDCSPRSRDSSAKFLNPHSSKRTASLDPAIQVPTLGPRTPRKSTGPYTGNVGRIRHENSEDEMEDWEIEPGVIAGSAPHSDDDSETEHNTAFSSVYTTSAEAGIKFSQFHFQVIRVVPGSQTPAHEVPFLRICSVATGKVEVQVGDNEFSIGAHGMWRIRAGEKCTLGNRHYSEAVIHVSTINIH